jgi:parvulin-like peptidyl-prolyl isomerase
MTFDTKVFKKLKSLNGIIGALPKTYAKNLRIVIIVLAAAILGYLGRSLIFAAAVNGQLITRLELIRELEKEGGAQTLDNLVTKALIFQEARNKGVTLSQEEINSEMTRIESLVSEQGSTLDEALALQGQKRSDLIEQIKLQKTVERLLSDKLTVTDEEINAYYGENKDFYGTDSKLEDVSEQIKSQLMQEKLTAAYQAWITQLKESAKVNYFVDFN